ncbi:Formate hydrogenlyase [Georgfuchsia toluolica]|uniref:Formate hydrogenlyase n=1 Tax=Georgfuchsia toluolica TaxID=424218 RepID=A0A916J8X3_9PROT|nr:formate hydrogenlyase [Georgfuchsia toluolica]CAG4884511.1 Formate hydrogenlyase [Georgfuchsia toluolica]
MEFASLGLYSQAIILFAALALFTSFIMLAQARMMPLIFTFAWQGLLLAMVSVLTAIASKHPELYVSAALTFILKVVLIPWLLYRLSIKLNMQYDAEAIEHPTLLLLGGVVLVIFSYFVAQSIIHLSGLATRNTIAVSIAIELLGMLLMCVRKSAVAQVIGFMSMESGIFFAAVVSTYGMPLIVELGVAFDILVAAILFGVFFFHLKDSFGSLNVGQFNRLSEANQPMPLRDAAAESSSGDPS